MTVSAKSSFFLDFMKVSIQCLFVSSPRKNASHLSMDTFLRFIYCAFPGPTTSGILNFASYMIVSDFGAFMTKYACKKCSTIFIFLLRSGCFSIKMISDSRIHGLSSKCFLNETYTPSLCSGGIPETSQFTTRLDVSLNWHIAKFLIPTSILRIIYIKNGNSLSYEE